MGLALQRWPGGPRVLVTVYDSQKEYWRGGGEEGRDWRHSEVGETHKDKGSGIVGYREGRVAPCGWTGGCSGDWGAGEERVKACGVRL